jgi:hypothetical protein
MNKEQLRIAVGKWAEEKARGDIKFCGPEAFAGIDANRVESVKQALVAYARNGALTAFDGIARHGHLKI